MLKGIYAHLIQRGFLSDHFRLNIFRNLIKYLPSYAMIYFSISNRDYLVHKIPYVP